MRFLLATLFATAVSSIAVDRLIPGAHITSESETSALKRLGAHHQKYHDRRTITIRPSRNDTDDISKDFLWGINHANHGGRLLLKKGEKYVIGRKLDLTFLDDIEVQLDGELKVFIMLRQSAYFKHAG
jgi:galacturan 1,4-alpha-galacturonidase